MTYYTAHDVSTDLALEYAALDADAIPEVKADAILRDAERMVTYYAPPPSPITTVYTEAAADAEMRIFDYLSATEGYLTSSGLSGISENFVDLEKVVSIISRCMATVSIGAGGSLGQIEDASLFWNS